MKTITEMTEPQRGPDAWPIRCAHCGQPIEAWATVTISGLAAGYEWRHIQSRARSCAVVRDARPYDGYAAESLLDAQRKAREAVSA